MLKLLAVTLCLTALAGCQDSTQIPGTPQGLPDATLIQDTSAGHGLLGTPKGSDDSDDDGPSASSTLPAHHDN